MTCVSNGKLGWVYGIQSHCSYDYYFVLFHFDSVRFEHMFHCLLYGHYKLIIFIACWSTYWAQMLKAFNIPYVLIVCIYEICSHFFSFFGKSEEKSQKQRLSHNSYNKNHIREWDLILTDKRIGNHLYWHSFSFVLFDVSHSMRNDDESGSYRLNIFRILQYIHICGSIQTRDLLYINLWF